VTVYMLLVLMVLLVLVRWLHLYWICLRPKKGMPLNPDKEARDWPAIGLGWLYAGLMIAWMSAFFLPHRLQTLRIAGALALLVVGVALRLAGQQALKDGFSWYWQPQSSALVTQGIYRWLKHPLLLGYFLEMVAFGMAAPIPLYLFGAGVAASAWLTIAQAVGEETRLAQKYGEQWRSFSRGKWG